MNAIAHDRLSQRYSLRGILATESALHIGTGQSGSLEQASDMPVTRDGRGRPYIPGSSFRGALRASLESLLRGLGRAEIPVCDPFEKHESRADRSCSQKVIEARKGLTENLPEAGAFDLAWTNSCEICRLFGHLFLASRVRIADLRLLSDPDDAPTYIRDGVGLDRDLRTAAGGILYNFEAVAPGARFELRMEIENPEPHEVGLLLVGLDLFSEGISRLGGKSARGLGLARVESLGISSRRAEDFFSGSKGATLSDSDLTAFRAAARTYYLGGKP